jgi:hypothetical protein
MKRLRYGNIKQSGNTKYAAPFKDMNVACMECDSGRRKGIQSRGDKGFKILKSEDRGVIGQEIAAKSPIPGNFKTAPVGNVLEYTLECLECGCVFTVVLREE